MIFLYVYSSRLIPLLPSLQEAAGRVRPSEKGPRQEGPVATAVAPRDAPGVAAERTRRRAHRRGQTAAATQRTSGGSDADTGGPQQTAGVPTAQAETAPGAGTHQQKHTLTHKQHHYIIYTE